MHDGPATSALLVTQHYWPEPIGSAPYMSDLGERLAARGLRVGVLTCRPHYPEGAVPDPYRRGRRDTEISNGVLIERVAPFRPGQRGALGRMIREGVFFLQGLWALMSRRICRSPLVVSLSPSIFAVLVGVLGCRRGGHHVVVVHDIQSGLAAGLGMVGGRTIAGLMRWLERVVLNKADVILVLSEDMRSHLLRQGVRVPIEVLPIWVDTGTIRPARAPRGRNVTVIYSGNLGRKQGLAQVIDMAEELARRNSPVQLLLRGEGSEAVKIDAEIAARGLDNIRMVPLVPMERLSEGLSEGAIHLVPQDAHTADFAVPSKAYAIMACGRPFVAAARPGSQLWRLCDRSGGFLCVPAGDPLAFADAVEQLVHDPALRVRLGRNGRRYVLCHHAKTLVLEKFLSIALMRGAGRPWHLHAPRTS